MSLRTALFLVAALGCTPDNEIQVQVHRDTFLQEPPSFVDILWVIDNSPSMQQEQEEVGRRFADYIAHLEETNIDFHIGVTTTDMDTYNPDRARLIGDPAVLTPDTPEYEVLFQEMVQVGVEGSDMERGLEAAWQALTEPMISDANAGFLRSEAVLSIIFVSDENDCSDQGGLPTTADGIDCYDQATLLVPVKDFVDDFRSLKADPADIIASAIVGPQVVEDCEDAKYGGRYLAAAEAMGGVQGSICEEDFSGIMDEMGLSVSGVRTSFQLEYRPVIESMIVYLAEDPDMAEDDWSIIDEGETDGWTYNEESRYLHFEGSAVPPRGSVVTVEYEIAGD